MAASPQLDKVLQIITDRKKKPPKTVDEGRLSYEMMVSSFQIDDDIHTERVGAGGVAAEWITAPGAENGSTLLYLHGGGFVWGSMRTHRVMLADISKAAGARGPGSSGWTTGWPRSSLSRRRWTIPFPLTAGF